MGSHCTNAEANLTEIRLLPQNNNYGPYLEQTSLITIVVIHFSRYTNTEKLKKLTFLLNYAYMYAKYTIDNDMVVWV